MTIKDELSINLIKAVQNEDLNKVHMVLLSDELREYNQKIPQNKVKI